jgi:DNA invertase Pin-like site-specific DNA recombinase
VSGAKVDRKGLREAFAKCAEIGGVILVARDLSRIGRTVRLLNQLNELMDQGAVSEIITTHDQAFGSGYQSKMMLGILLVVGQSERDAASERVKRRQAHDRAAGKPHTGGYRSFGWERDGETPIPAEVAQINEAIDYVLAGGSLSSLARTWRSEGRKTTTGGNWSYQSLQALLTKERLGVLVGEDRAEPVRLAIADRGAQYGTRSRVFTRWLNGTMTCGECGEKLDSHNFDGKPQYGCSRQTGCSKIWVSADHLEALMTGFVKAMSLPGIRPDDGYATVLAERTKNREQIDRLTDLFVSGDLTKADYAKRKAALEALGSKMDADLLTHSASAAMAGSVEVWDSLDARQRRSVVEFQLGTFTVNKGTGKNVKGRKVFDPNRFVFDRPEVQQWWRGYVRRL